MSRKPPTRERIERTFELTREIFQRWNKPPFQREVRVNENLRSAIDEIRDTGIIPGVLTVGRMAGKEYLVDGQHRGYGFEASGLESALADIRIIDFDNFADMAREFVRLNSSIARMRPDDILRGVEEGSSALRRLREECHFVGYDCVRRGEHSPVVSMSVVLRAWRGSAPEVPSTSGCGSAFQIASAFTEDDAKQCTRFLKIAIESWGRDKEYQRLWGTLNLILCMWLYRRMVLTRSSHMREQIGDDLFSKCLMALSANSKYLDWLGGRVLGERDRSPAYARIKQIFVGRLREETGRRPNLPAPPWANNIQVPI